MLVEDLIRVLPVNQKVAIICLNNVYEGYTQGIPKILLEYEVISICDFKNEDCIYISVYAQ